jgi:HSP90 family molecular chaperone
MPVQVTVTNQELSIRDFGTGIHDDDMAHRYGTYGGSTKEKDSRVTGGFGLSETRL